MICINICLISAGLLGAMLTTMLSNNLKSKNEQMGFTQKQKEIYSLIVKERTMIYFKGLVVGVLVSMIYLYLSKGLVASNLCTVIAITLMVSTFFYLLSPKKHYMVQHMTSIEQVRKWNTISKKMKRSYNVGFLFGLVLYILIIFSINR